MEGGLKALAKGVAAVNGTKGDPMTATEAVVPPNGPNEVAEAPAATLAALGATVGWIFKIFVTRAMQSLLPASCSIISASADCTMLRTIRREQATRSCSGAVKQSKNFERLACCATFEFKLGFKTDVMLSKDA